MKKTVAFLFFALLLFGCQKDLVEKPDNLIDKKVMGDILYDMSILEALRFQDPNSLVSNGVNPRSFVYKKYKIDSLQFAKSSAYYASQYGEYKEMYEQLQERISKEKQALELIAKKQAALLKAKVQDSIKKAKGLKSKKDSIGQQKAKGAVESRSIGSSKSISN